MTKTTKCAFLSMLLCLASAGAYALVPLPMLRVMQMTGKLLVTTNLTEGLHNGGLQFIPSGSYVRVESGVAWFESRGHVMIRAKQGDAFLFSASDPTEGNTTVIQALEAPTGSLDVYVGGLKYLLKDAGAVSISLSEKGEARVKVEGGNVSLAPGSSLRAGERSAFRYRGRPGGGMALNDVTTVNVRATPGFRGLPIAASSMKVTRLGEATLVAEKIQPGAGYVMAALIKERRAIRIARRQRIAKRHMIARQERALRAEDDLRSAVANAPANSPSKTAFTKPQIRLFTPEKYMIAQPAAQVRPSLWERARKSGALMWGGLAALLAVCVFIILRRG